MFKQQSLWLVDANRTNDKKHIQNLKIVKTNDKDTASTARNRGFPAALKGGGPQWDSAPAVGRASLPGSKDGMGRKEKGVS